jgi:hypothetical protein
MFSENVMSADNQQERLYAEWIVGFVDGEGCFHVAINRIKKMRLGWQVLPEFRVVQHEKDVVVLQKLQQFFGFGSVKQNRKDLHGIRMEYRVRGLHNLIKLVDFFKNHPFQTPTKQINFEKFCQILYLMKQKKHLTKDGLNKIAEIISTMNRQPLLRYIESSETIRQTPQLLVKR